MSDAATWLESNTRYLAKAVAQLRILLEQRAGPAHDTALAQPREPTPRQEKPKAGWWLFGKKLQSEVIAKAPDVLTANETTNAEAQTDALLVVPPTDTPPALLILGQRLGLSHFELEILLLCVAMELDTGIARLCARAQADPARSFPTFALALTLFNDPAWDALSPERPLRHWRLIEINQPGAQPLTTSPLRADERVVNYLKGLNYLDDRLAPFLTAMELPQGGTDLPPSQQVTVETILRALRQSTSRQSFPVVQLLGTHAPSKQLVAGYVANALGVQVYRLPVGWLPTQTSEIETLARLWQRESLLLPITLFLDAYESDGDAYNAGQTYAVLRLLDRVNGVIFLSTRDAWPALAKPTLSVDVAKPNPAEQQSAWRAALGDKAEKSPELLAGQFNLDIANIEEVSASALAEGAADDRSLSDRLWDACLARSRPRLENLAQRIETKASWDDIVLPDAEAVLLKQIADQVGWRSAVYDGWGFRSKMSRGLGINALFAGESGTGKTMAAEVLANHLRLNLYRIDLSAVVSKYIGESEKNLRKLFDAAEDVGCILFFDEADALFGKRSEVKDSHDRYANIEINYLLQRMEAYRGLAILATNMKTALDPAFLRRLRFVVNFPFPGVAERKAIWQKVFPADTPTIGLEYDRLARLNVAGGHIHNIGLNAAFLAAQAGTAVTMATILAAARIEFRKLDKAINEADFRWSDVAGAVA